MNTESLRLALWTEVVYGESRQKPGVRWRKYFFSDKEIKVLVGEVEIRKHCHWVVQIHHAASRMLSLHYYYLIIIELFTLFCNLMMMFSWISTTNDLISSLPWSRPGLSFALWELGMWWWDSANDLIWFIWLIFFHVERCLWNNYGSLQVQQQITLHCIRVYEL